jgi:2-polyprenyl-3-methyl-5-hydroxy-6-metoxy-1,4-benzoquinol methylase
MELTAKMEPFDSFWEAPEDIEKGYEKFLKFYKRNYLAHIPKDKDISALIVSCGPGYFVNLLNKEGYSNVLGIDSDQHKIQYAQDKGLNCRVHKAFDFLAENKDRFDLIVAEQEINHLTMKEIIHFFQLCRDNLSDHGVLVLHSINGANPITGIESLTQNIDHYNAFTEYSLRQVLEYAHFSETKIIPLNLYIFYENPLNYIGLFIHYFYEFFFRINFILYGKTNRIFTKKIAAIAKIQS